MLIDWLKTLRTKTSSASRRRMISRRTSTSVGIPTQLEPRTLLSSVPIGPAFRVNSWTTNNQTHASIAMDADGDYVVTWSSSGQDGSGYGIYAQRYNALGVPQGSEFQVNT